MELPQSTLRVSPTEWLTCLLLCEIMRSLPLPSWSRQRRTPSRSRRPTALTVGAAPSTDHPDRLEPTTGANDSEGTDNRGVRTTSTAPVDYETSDMSEKSAALSQTKADSDELKPDCMNSHTPTVQQPVSEESSRGRNECNSGLS